MTAIELMTKLNDSPVEEWATIAANSKVVGAKDVYLAMGKSHSIPLKELEADWKEAQPKKATGSAKGFAAEYYDWLAGDSKTEQEARDYILDPANSKNVHNHLTHYLNIWALCETVRSGKKQERTYSKAKTESKAEEPKQEPKEEKSEQQKDIDAAWDMFSFCSTNSCVCLWARKDTRVNINFISCSANLGWQS